MPIKSVVINGRFLTRQRTGVDRFAYETVAALDRLISEGRVLNGVSVDLAVPSSFNDSIEYEAINVRRVGRRSGVAWEQFDLWYATRNELLVNLCNSGPLLSKHQIVVIHDVTPARVPEAYSWAFRRWYDVIIPLLYRRSASVCTVSNFSRSELAAVFGPRDRVVVLPEGADHMGRIEADENYVERNGLDRRPYVLAVSSMAPHKNFASVARAASLLSDRNFDFVVAGGTNPKVFAASGATGEGIHFLGYVTDGELKALYENAACFVFPSLYEGYGLPPTEAMACGCPVVSSDAASMPEVCGDGAVYFDPTNTDSLMRCLVEVMNDGVLRDKLAHRGRSRAANMNWHNAAMTLAGEIARLV